jgi:exoribonuclease-2
MMNGKQQLQQIADQALDEHNLAIGFSREALGQLDRIHRAAPIDGKDIIDCRQLLWCSIDNDDSRDLDQLTYARQEGETIIAYVAVADVDALVAEATPLDLQAQINTTSIYTAGKMFPMLPEKLSTDLTSLNEEGTRCAMIFEMRFNGDGDVQEYKIYRGAVINKAKLTYSSVGGWLQGALPVPDKINAIEGLAETIQLQDRLAQAIKAKRHAHGALTLQTIELKASFDSAGKIVNMDPLEHNRAHELIENLMIAANTSSARYMASHQLPSFRRIVREPERWDRIVDLAGTYRANLPAKPDSGALDRFLIKMQLERPDVFPDISLAVVKLLGSGEYIVEKPGDAPIGHFGLALREYSHSTAPNRRYPDLITQRLLKASLQGRHLPYTFAELEKLAAHCTEREDTAAKVERQLLKSAAAMLLSGRIDEIFDAVITGASIKGTWVRLERLYIEGKLILGAQGLDVGDSVRVKLVSVDIPKGYIDFVRVRP